MNLPPPGPPTWQRISAALDPGLDLAPAEREGWLAGLEESDPNLANESARPSRLQSNTSPTRVASDHPELLHARDFLQQYARF